MRIDQDMRGVDDASGVWMLPRISDYCDQPGGSAFEEGAIHRHSRRLASLSGPARTLALGEINDSMGRHCEALDDEMIVMAAFILAEDLYKAASVLTYLDDPMHDYLSAVCRPFWLHLKTRGYSVHYVVDNGYQNTHAGMTGPLRGFPALFGAAGLLYVCPQALAVHLMEADEVPSANLHERMNHYIREAREVAGKALDRFRDERVSFIYLDTDATDESLRFAISEFEHPGVIGLLRTEVSSHETAKNSSRLVAKSIIW